MRSAVIKAGQSPRFSRGLAHIDLRDIAQRGEVLLSDARAQADQIVQDALEQAQRERTAILETAHEQGFEAGRAEGGDVGREDGLREVRQQFAEQQADLISTLSGMLESFHSQREKFQISAKRDVVVLAIAMASRIVGKLMEIQPVANAAAEEACREAIEMVGQATEVLVRVNPADAEAIERLNQELAVATTSSRHIRLLVDENIDRGGVVVETAKCDVDAGVNTRIERIADELVADWRERVQGMMPGM